MKESVFAKTNNNEHYLVVKIWLLKNGVCQRYMTSAEILVKGHRQYCGCTAFRDECIPHTRILTVHTSLTAEQYVLDRIQYVLLKYAISDAAVVRKKKRKVKEEKIQRTKTEKEVC